MSDTDGWTGTWCPQCGPHVGVDEDGCCNSCGCVAAGDGVEAMHTRLAAAEHVVEALPRCHECGGPGTRTDGYTHMCDEHAKKRDGRGLWPDVRWADALRRRAARLTTTPRQRAAIRVQVWVEAANELDVRASDYIDSGTTIQTVREALKSAAAHFRAMADKESGDA